MACYPASALLGADDGSGSDSLVCWPSSQSACWSLPDAPGPSLSPRLPRAQTLLSEDGDIREAPLLHPVDEDALEEAEVREGAPIERTERVPCTIALAKVGD